MKKYRWLFYIIGILLLLTADFFAIKRIIEDKEHYASSYIIFLSSIIVFSLMFFLGLKSHSKRNGGG